MIEQALASAKFNKSKAAKALGLTRHQLYVRMRKHGLEKPFALALTEAGRFARGESPARASLAGWPRAHARGPFRRAERAGLLNRERQKHELAAAFELQHDRIARLQPIERGALR